MNIKHIIKICLFILGLSIMPLMAYTAVPEWQIIPAESQLNFTGTQNGAPVSGAFKVFTGTLLIEPSDLKNSSIDIIVDINSISASYAELKGTLVSPDWFDAKIFPKAEFKSTQIEKIDEKNYQAKGILTIRDKSQPLTLSFSVQQLTSNKGAVIGNAVIKRTLFGVGQGEWAGTNEIKDEVIINFKVAAVKKH
ncbi:MAG: YceI family protein [Legionellales bacterium]